MPSEMNQFRKYALGRDKDALKSELPETKCLVITSWLRVLQSHRELES